MTNDFQSETIQASRQQMTSSKVLKENSQRRILYPKKIFFKNEDEINFSDN